MQKEQDALFLLEEDATQLAQEQQPQKSFDDWLKENKEYQAEFDRRTAKGIKTARAAWEKQAQEREQELLRISRLSQEEQAQEALKQALKKVEDLERQNSAILLKQETTELLTQQNLPASFADILVGENAEDTRERIARFSEAFNAAVAKEVQKRMPGYQPQAGTGADLFLEGFGKSNF